MIINWIVAVVSVAGLMVVVLTFVEWGKDD